MDKKELFDEWYENHSFWNKPVRHLLDRDVAKAIFYNVYELGKHHGLLDVKADLDKRFEENKGL